MDSRIADHVGGSAARARRIATAIAAAAALLVAGLPGDADARDRNRDRIPDSWEKRHKLSLKKNQARKDQDRDGVRNRHEYRFRLDPRSEDSDGDGTDDGDEMTGKVASFDSGTGRLVIDLRGGDSIAGLVTEETEIECDRADEVKEKIEHEEEIEHESEDGEFEFEEEYEFESEVETDDGENCSADALQPGALVQEAELELDGGIAVWEEVELVEG